MVPDLAHALAGLRWLALMAQVRHNQPVAETTAARGESRKVPRRTHRHLAGFFRPYASVRLLWAGDGGEGKSPAGSLGRRSLNPAICPPTPFESGARVYPSKEATMPGIASRTPAQLYPFSCNAGQRAAALWLSTSKPPLSLHDWQANRRAAFLAGQSADWQAAAAFDLGFEQAIAAHIAGGGGHV